MIVVHTWLSVAVIGANPHDRPLSKAICLEKVDPALEAAKAPLDADGLQPPQEALPLVKIAHSNVIDLMQLFFVPKPMLAPSYTPLVQQVGVRVNWLTLLRNMWPNGQKRYGGGVDLHFRAPLQLSVALGYLSDQPKERIHGNALYRSQGSYGAAALLYVMHLNPLTNAYFGIAYGQSRFNLTTFCNEATPLTSKPLVAGWIKCIGESEYKLVAQLYGGMQFGVAYLLHCTQNDGNRVLNYAIPGYGKIANKLIPDVTLYLKWSIFFLEKKIVV